MKNLISIHDLTSQEVKEIFRTTKLIEENHFRKYHKKFILASLFFEPSTRTRLSFESACLKLGGQVINLGEDSSIKKGETAEDTVLTVSRYADLLVIRHKEEIDFTPYSKVPIINAGSSHINHPTQALLDLYTIQKYHKNKKLKILFTGDLLYSRTINSLLELLKLEEYDAELIFSNKTNYEGKYVNEEEILNYISEIDVLYMTRLQKERHKEKVDSNFILNNNLANKMREDAIIMHPFPRNNEISKDVDRNKRAVYFNQIQNGLYIRMALIMNLIH